ncbi:uncharacterized protein B0I36DRAFT_345027 [Microdochium trichocladiopsis]|uniref:Thioredoxin-like fold domain-containing protein n=1 Tax=Microdochium trichocladiopsis TaxID=1682393 RepID=A0A9P8YJH4_9PEZI|nr:uncharacterized protein B0I36DRAFT_345027 [Microdochium trichocladiopsis]KAH7041420.1 hypothetical protein B0I36DRAFT_345027 [Microdochium trichocladiopsis]
MPKDQAASQLTLFRGWDEKGRHVWSPFVIKLEARLRFADLKYTTAVGSPRTAPKGKIPYLDVTDTQDGVTSQFSDSSLIIADLMDAGLLPALNDDLDAVQRSHDLALRAMLEDKLYFYHTRERWIENYYTMRDYALWSAPYPVRVVVGLMVYRKTNAMLHGQGTGRFSADEIAKFKLGIWTSINDLLVESRSGGSAGAANDREPFWALGGERPTEADCTLFGFVVSVMTSTACDKHILLTPQDSGPESRRIVQRFPVILDFASRIQDKYFPDYEKFI